MKTISRVLCIGIVLVNAVSAEDHIMPLLNITITNVTLAGRVSLEIATPSSGGLRMWKESNSWGAAHWRVIVLRNGAMQTFYQNPLRLFTKNNPRFDRIAVGTHIQKQLDLNGGNWCGLGYCSSYNEHGFGGKKFELAKNDTVLVLYDVPFTSQAQKMGVWYGVTGTFTVIH